MSFGNFSPFNEHSCPSGGEDKTSKEHLRRRFSSLVREDLIGHSLTVCSHFTERDRRRKNPVFRALGEAL